MSRAGSMEGLLGKSPVSHRSNRHFSYYRGFNCSWEKKVLRRKSFQGDERLNGNPVWKNFNAQEVTIIIEFRKFGGQLRLLSFRGNHYNNREKNRLWAPSLGIHKTKLGIPEPKTEIIWIFHNWNISSHPKKRTIPNLNNNFPNQVKLVLNKIRNFPNENQIGNILYHITKFPNEIWHTVY